MQQLHIYKNMCRIKLEKGSIAEQLTNKPPSRRFHMFRATNRQEPVTQPINTSPLRDIRV